MKSVADLMGKQNWVSSWDTQHNAPHWLIAGGTVYGRGGQRLWLYSLYILITNSTSGTQRQLLVRMQIHYNKAIGTTAFSGSVFKLLRTTVFSGSVFKLPEAIWHFPTLHKLGQISKYYRMPFVAKYWNYRM